MKKRAESLSHSQWVIASPIVQEHPWHCVIGSKQQSSFLGLTHRLQAYVLLKDAEITISSMQLSVAPNSIRIDSLETFMAEEMQTFKTIATYRAWKMAGDLYTKIGGWWSCVVYWAQGVAPEVPWGGSNVV